MKCEGCGRPLQDGEPVYQVRYGYYSAEEGEFEPEQDVGLFHSECWAARGETPQWLSEEMKPDAKHRIAAQGAQTAASGES